MLTKEQQEELEYELQTAAEKGNISKIKRLLKAGINVDSDNGAPLYCAVVYKKERSIEFLLKNGADPCRENNRAICSAAKSGDCNIGKLLFEYGADVTAPECEALYLAAINGRTEFAELLLQNKADLHKENEEALYTAINVGYFETALLFLRYGADINALDKLFCSAAGNGRYKIVEFMLNNGFDISANNGVALQWAAESGHLEIVELLSRSGADVHAGNEAALCAAIGNAEDEEALKIVRFFVEECSADIHVMNDYPLRLAVAREKTLVAEYLLEKGADPHANKDEALENAREKENGELVKVISKHFWDPKPIIF